MMKNSKKKVGITAFTLIVIFGVSAYTTVMTAGALKESKVTEISEDIEIKNLNISRDGTAVKISPDELIDNGDGSYTYNTEGGQEITLNLPKNPDGRPYKIANAKLQFETSDSSELQPEE